MSEAPLVDDAGAMALALAEARAAGDAGEIPVGAVVVLDGQVLGRAGNRREAHGDPTAHAEVLALRQAAGAVGSWRLDGAVLYVTLEPCPMCAGAAVASRLRRVVYGAANVEAGACGTLYNLCADPRLNHEVEVAGGLQAEAAGALLTEFFARRRDPGGPLDPP